MGDMTTRFLSFKFLAVKVLKSMNFLKSLKGVEQKDEQCLSFMWGQMLKIKGFIFKTLLGGSS